MIFEHGLMAASRKVALSKRAARLTQSGVTTQSDHFSRVELTANPITGRRGLKETGRIVREGRGIPFTAVCIGSDVVTFWTDVLASRLVRKERKETTDEMSAEEHKAALVLMSSEKSGEC